MYKEGPAHEDNNRLEVPDGGAGGEINAEAGRDGLSHELTPGAEVQPSRVTDQPTTTTATKHCKANHWAKMRCSFERLINAQRDRMMHVQEHDAKTPPDNRIFESFGDLKVGKGLYYSPGSETVMVTDNNSPHYGSIITRNDFARAFFERRSIWPKAIAALTAGFAVLTMNFQPEKPKPESTPAKAVPAVASRPPQPAPELACFQAPQGKGCPADMIHRVRTNVTECCLSGSSVSGKPAQTVHEPQPPHRLPTPF